MAFSLNILTRLLAAIREETSQLLPPITGYEKEPLLPLKEACRPLKRILTKELKTYITIALINVERPRDGLTQDEAAALYLYSMQWPTAEDSLYFVLNDTLRAADREELVPWHRYLKLLLTAFHKLP